MRTLQLTMVSLALVAAGCMDAGPSAGPDGGPAEDTISTLATSATTVDLVPTSTVTNDNVVGVGDATALFHDVDDGVGFALANDSTDYVRGKAGLANTSHTVGYSGAPAGTATAVVVNYRAQRGSAQGTAQVLLFDGTTKIGTGAVHTLGSYANFTDSYAGLSVSNANNLRTQILFHNTAATGALRYTQIWLHVSLGATTCTPATCAALGDNCGSVSDGCGGTLTCGTCNSPQTCGGGGKPNVCGGGSTCVPTTCAALGDNCGSVSDGCGGTLTCGTCTSPQTCGGGGTANVCGGGSTASLCGSSAAPPTRYKHVVVIMEENRTWSTVGGVGFGDPTMPFIHSVAQQCTTFSSWTETNTSQNSLNQYIGLASGISNTATVNDCAPSATCRSTDDNIFRQVRVSGGTARNYVEGATTGCSAAGNAAKHVPALYFFGTYTDATGAHNDHDFCTTEVRPLTEFDPNNLPTFAMITPNLCNDGHDCNNATVDTFAKKILPSILSSSSYKAGDTLVVVLYDEDHPVPNLLIAPTATAGISAATGAGHAAMLRTWEELLGLPLMQQGELIGAVSLRAPAHI